MRIIIRKIKYRAAGRFWAAAEEQNKNKYGLDKFDIPQEIFDLAPTLPQPKKMPYYETLTESQKQIARDINDAFDNLWKKHQKDINKVLKKLKTTDFKKKWLKKEIPKTTGIDWPFKEIYIFPGIINWARSQKNQLCIGIRPKHALKKNNLIPLLIHELIHINTWDIWETRSKQKLFYKKDSIEISTTLLTNKIVRNMNDKFNIHIADQELPSPFKNLEKFMPHFEKLLNQSKSYKELIFKVDGFLKSIKHKAYYR
ncbi:MAG: hypothetical protein AB7D02_02775 [Candidatus Paceibacterota bacterium]|jgi:hypothetical protein